MEIWQMGQGVSKIIGHTDLNGDYNLYIDI